MYLDASRHVHLINNVTGRIGMVSDQWKEGIDDELLVELDRWHDHVRKVCAEPPVRVSSLDINDGRLRSEGVMETWGRR
jgi:hypothetical protein